MNSKPRVLFVVNKPNWASDLNARDLQLHLGGEFEFVRRHRPELTKTDLDRSDLIVVFSWLQIQQTLQLETAFERNRHKLLMGIIGHIDLEGELREPGLLTFQRFARAAYAISQLLYDEFKSILQIPFFYAPSGVDTKFFSPARRKESYSPLRVGWSGKRSGFKPEQKGLNDIIVPAVRLVEGVQLVTAIREDKWRNREEMREFYQSLDVYLCASQSEGSPNTCLEAAACGVPLITTRVGNMPELIQDGVNGLFIRRDVQDMAAQITLLRDNPELRNRLSAAMLASIQAWDWSIQAERYRQMFETILSGEVDAG